MAIIATLAAIAVPSFTRHVQGAKEAVLKEDLHVMRTAIDSYTVDQQKAPQTLDDLVNDGYLRAVPLDPITNSSQSWRLVMEDAVTSVDQTMPGIYDVRSGSDQKSLEGTPYAEW